MTGGLRHPLLFLLLALTATLCLPLTLRSGRTPYTMDETVYYLPAIRQIQAEWPRLDIRGTSLSATAPGYQYLLATLALPFGDNLRVLRFINLAVSLVLPVVLWFAWPAAAAGAVRFWSLLPLVGGCFFVRAASNVMTDNAALLAVGATLALVLVPRRPGAVIWSGLTATLAVLVRQITIWLEAPLLVRLLFLRHRGAWLAALLAPLALGALLVIWGGLVPPAWQARHSGGLGLAAAPYQLAVVGLLGVFFLQAGLPGWPGELRRRPALAGGVAGLLVALTVSTAPDYDAGRWGGYLWIAAEHLPVWGERSVVFLLLSPLGGAVLALLIQRLRQTAGTEATLTWCAALGALLASGLLNRQVHHRYYEPPVLVLLMFWLLLLVLREPSLRIRLAPLAGLSAGQVGITLLTAYGRTLGYF